MNKGPNCDNSGHSPQSKSKLINLRPGMTLP